MIVLLLGLHAASARAMPDTLRWQSVATENQFSIPSITDMEYDRKGNLWISTFDGLLRFDGYRYHKYKVVEDQDMGLVKQKVLSIHKDDQGEIWFAGPYSVYRYSEKYDNLERMTETLRTKHEDLYSIAYFDIEDLDKSHKILGTKQGAWLYHVPTQTIKKHLPIVDSLIIDRYSTNAHIFKFAQDQIDSTKLWLLTKGSLAAMNKKTLETVHYPIPAALRKSRFGDRGQSIVCTRDKVFVLINFLHLLEFNKETKQWKKLILSQTNGKTKHVRNLLPYEDGFIINYIAHSIEYHNAISNERVILNEKHPFGEKEYAHSHITYDHNGHLTYIFNNQLLCRSTTSIIPSQREQSIFTTALHIEGVSRPDSVESNELITLPEYQRNISFDVGLTNRDNADIEQFQYRINNGDWQDISNRNIALQNMSHGHYDISVRAITNGKEYEARVKRFYIKAFFYETWWFITLILLSILGVASTLLHFYNLRKKDQEKYKQQLLNLEMNALRSQMNPHFLFNSLNSIKNYVVSKSRDEAADYLTSFSKLMRMILENSRKKFMTLDEELKMIALYIEMECTRLNHSFEYDIKVDSDIDLEFLLPPMLLQPYVENAIWHGLMGKYGHKQLTVSIKAIPNGISCIIRDNGIGRKASMQNKRGATNSKKSLGMKITSDRFKIFNQLYNIETSCTTTDLYNDKNEAIGTEVIISLPKIDNRMNEIL